MSEQADAYLNDTVRPVPPLAVNDWLADYDVARCYYCGEPAGTIDHVVPQSMLRTFHIIGYDVAQAILARHSCRMTVSSCMECNSLLGPKYFDTLERRKDFLKKRMRQRYRALLRMPDWTDRELSQLTGRLREAVIGSLVKRDIILRRLRY